MSHTDQRYKCNDDLLRMLYMVMIMYVIMMMQMMMMTSAMIMGLHLSSHMWGTQGDSCDQFTGTNTYTNTDANTETYTDACLFPALQCW